MKAEYSAQRCRVSINHRKTPRKLCRYSAGEFYTSWYTALIENTRMVRKLSVGRAVGGTGRSGVTLPRLSAWAPIPRSVGRRIREFIPSRKCS